MPLILSSGPVTSDHDTQPSREARFGRQRFLNPNEKTSLPFISRKHTRLGTLASTPGCSNEEVIQPLTSFGKTITLVSFVTLLWMICVVFGLPDIFPSKHLTTTFSFRLGQHDVEVYIIRRQDPMLPVSLPLEYASLSVGGRTIGSLTSATLSPPSRRHYLFFSQKGKPSKVQEPALALTDGMEPGQCWPFKGDAGQLGIQLPHAIRVTHLSVGSPNTSSMTSVPKNLVLWGLKRGGSEDCSAFGDVVTHKPDFGSRYCGIRLLSGIYEPEFSMPTYYQNFTTTYEDYFDQLVFQVLGNWGSVDFTCIYRVLIYGTAQTL